MTIKTRLVVSGIWLIVLATVSTGCRSPEARGELRELFSRLESATTKADVERIYRERKYQTLKLRESREDLWVVETPLEFAAKNWVLYLEFSNSRLIASRIRTADSQDEQPADAPPDRIAPP
jgi:hypothetical protein